MSKKSTKAKAAPRSAASRAKAKTPAKTTSKTEAIHTAPPSAASANTLATKAAEATLVNKPQPVVLGPVMRKKELIDTVVARTGMKKKDAKPVIEGMLAVLGGALAEGRELILPPLGKVLVRKEKMLPNGKMMIVKVRQSKPPMQADLTAASDTIQ